MQFYLIKHLFPPSGKIMNSDVFFAWAMEIWASVSIKSKIQKESMHWRTEALCGMKMKAMRPHLKTIKLACRQQTVSLHIWWMPVEHGSHKCLRAWGSVCFRILSAFTIFLLLLQHFCSEPMLFSEPYTDCFPFVLIFFSALPTKISSLQSFLYFTYSRHLRRLS